MHQATTSPASAPRPDLAQIAPDAQHLDLVTEPERRKMPRRGSPLRGPLSPANAGHLRYVMDKLRCPELVHPGTLPATLPAGHASSILVTRSEASLLVNSAFNGAKLFEHTDDQNNQLVMSIS